MSIFNTIKRKFSSWSPQMYNVAVLGAGGGIGQPLSMLMKLDYRVTNLRLFDIKGAKGVATDLSHISTNSRVSGHDSDEQDGLKSSLSDSDVVIVSAGVPRKPGMSRDDLFMVNAGIVKQLASGIADHAGDAAILVISNPVNSTVPVMVETLKKYGVYNPHKVFGVTTLDVMRASKFVGDVCNSDPTQERVSVVGGHSGITIIPLLSQTSHKFSSEERARLVNRIQFGGDEVVKAKNGAGSATLSMAFAGARFAGAVMDGLSGKSDVVEAAFVDSPLYKKEGIEFFSSPVTLGPQGIQKVHDIGPVSIEEEEMIQACKDTLRKNIQRGIDFGNSD